MFELTIFNLILWTIFAFFCGALPFAWWIGRMAGVEIRTVADGNPGATNVFRAAGFGWGMAAICAEFSKAAVPVGLAYFIFGWDSYAIVPIALAPSFGHIFSPLLGGRGGKGLATMLGAWIGMTLWIVPTILLVPLCIVQFVFKPKDPLRAVLPPIAIAFIWFVTFGWNPIFVVVLICQFALVLYTHLFASPEMADHRTPAL